MERLGKHDQSEALSDKEVVQGFKDETIPGREVMGRLLERLDMGHRRQEALVRQDGTPITTADGEPVLAEDYLDIADGHQDAANVILGFMTLDEAHPKYEAFRATITSVVAGYLPPENAG